MAHRCAIYVCSRRCNRTATIFTLNYLYFQAFSLVNADNLIHFFPVYVGMYVSLLEAEQATKNILRNYIINQLLLLLMMKNFQLGIFGNFLRPNDTQVNFT